MNTKITHAEQKPPQSRRLITKLLRAVGETPATIITPQDSTWKRYQDDHLNHTTAQLQQCWDNDPLDITDHILKALRKNRGNHHTYEAVTDFAARLVYPRATAITQELQHTASSDQDIATLCARVCAHAAFRARGDNYLEETSPDQIRAFTHYLTRGNAFLENHPENLNRCTTAITTVLAHMVGMNHDDTLAYALYDDARTLNVDFWPATYWLTQSRRPVWGGDLPQLLSLSQDILAEVAAGSPQSIVAALASRYLDDPLPSIAENWKASAEPTVVEELWTTSHNVLNYWQNFPDPQWATIHQIFAAETYRRGFPNLAEAHLQHTTPYLSHYTRSVVAPTSYYHMMRDLNVHYSAAVPAQTVHTDPAGTP